MIDKVMVISMSLSMSLLKSLSVLPCSYPYPPSQRSQSPRKAPEVAESCRTLKEVQQSLKKYD